MTYGNSLYTLSKKQSPFLMHLPQARDMDIPMFNFGKSKNDGLIVPSLVFINLIIQLIH